MAGPGRTLNDAKRAESADGNLIACCQVGLYGVKNRGDNGGHMRLRLSGLARNGSDQVLFSHETAPFALVSSSPAGFVLSMP